MQLDQSLIKDANQIPAKFHWDNLKATSPSRYLGYENPPEGAVIIRSPIDVKENGSPITPTLGWMKQMTAAEGMTLLDDARKAFNFGRGAWAGATFQERIKAVRAFADDLEKVEEPVALSIMWEIAKTWADSLAEVRRTVAYIRETCTAYEEACRGEDKENVEQGFFAKTRRVPLGVVLVVGPFNYPLNETYTTLIPALLVGNSVILKHARIGILLHNPILPLFEKHFPKGSIGLLFGDGKELITPIMKSGQIDALAFIGSSGVANAIMANHPKPNRMRAILGLEAKNVGVILPDADLEATAKECAQGALTFNGQRCTALKFLMVHSSIHDKFTQLLVKEVEALKVGMPWETGTQITPLAEPGKVNWLLELQADAISKGSVRLNQTSVPAVGTIFHPAILDNVPDTAKLAQIEQFGPILPMRPFSEPMEVLEYVQNSNYGQQASVFGTGKDAAFLVDALTRLVARVNVNTQCRRGPDTFAFGGRKDSAAGTLSVRDALRCFSIRSVVSCKADLNHTERQTVNALVTSGNQFLRLQS